MPIQQSSRPRLTVPKSILIARCKEVIDAGEREQSINILLRLSELSLSATEQIILKTLKSKHRTRFEKSSKDWITSGNPVCGTILTIDIASGKSIHGGKRMNLYDEAYNGKPKVSIITVNLNCAEGLEKTIKSVISQKNDMCGIEHIIIDGNSNDNSIQIIRKYEHQIDYFISEPDGGIYAAMNKGLRLAQGEIIAFLNADDTYRRGAAKISAENIEHNRIDISYGAFAYIKQNGYNEVIDGPREWDPALLIRGIPGGHGTFFVTKDAYNKVGTYREDLKIVSDYDWMIRAYLAGCTANPLQKILHEMTQGGISFNNTIEKEENCRMLTKYLGESDPQRIDELYSLKYYLNWQGNAKPKQQQLRLLEMAENLQDFEPLYARALVKTLYRNGEKRRGIIKSSTEKEDGDRLKVCVAVTYLNSIAGGAERIAIEAANHLAKQGHAVTIICCHGLAGEPFYTIDEGVELIDLANRPLSTELHEIGIIGWQGSWEEIRQQMGVEEFRDINEWLTGGNKWRTLVYRGFFKANSFDAIISHMPSSYPHIALALSGTPAPPLHIASLHSSPYHKFHSELYYSKSIQEKRVWLATLGMCDRITVLFKEYIDDLPERLRHKVVVVPNFIGSGFFDTQRPQHSVLLTKTIVAVGRLVSMKNHKILIDAFALNTPRMSGWKLEIYGEGPFREELQTHCASRGLDPESVLLGNTDTPEEVYKTSDIFVCPSSFEGFGLSLVEAMAHGVPVIGFDDCPGVKFIIENGVNGLLTKRDEKAMNLADAIFKLADDEKLRQTLGANAIVSAAKYTIDEHVAKLETCFPKLRKVPVPKTNEGCMMDTDLNVAILTTSISGGAGIAASRLQGGLQKIGISSSIFSSGNGSMEPSYTLQMTDKEPELNSRNWKISNRSNLKNAGATIFSSELGSVGKSALKAVAAYDVINLHWVSNFLSPTFVSSLLESEKPVVWTLHDMLPFTGGCHYASGCDYFTNTCADCPQIINNFDNHPQRIVEMKSRLWQDRITIISPSVWLAKEAKKSRVFCNSRIEVIPNGIDTMEYQPWNKHLAKKILGLPQDKKIILFACHSHAERRKGFQEALMMLISLSRRRRDLHLVTLGRSSDETNQIPISNSVLGFVNSSRELSMIYSACDVTVLPSLEDNLPNTILESFACGTPIAGFRAGGIEELVKDGSNGHLAPLRDILALRDAVEKCIDSDLRENCRSYAVQNLDYTKQANAYADVFHSLSKNRG